MITKRIAKVILIIIAAVLALVAGLLIFLTATEYHPEDVENLDINGTAKATYSVGDPLTAMTWNIGYGALGDNADFFMDGGEMVKSADENRVQENMDGIMDLIDTVGPDMFLLQEADRDSSRSYHIDEVKLLRDRLDGYASTYGINYKTPFVPYPFPPLGKIDAGGGGTIAYICALYGMEVIDSGVAVLSMHAPMEIISKADLYEAAKAYKAFMLNA